MKKSYLSQDPKKWRQKAFQEKKIVSANTECRVCLTCSETRKNVSMTETENTRGKAVGDEVKAMELEQGLRDTKKTLVLL